MYNPILGNTDLCIAADADLILDNELIDLKTSKYNKIGNNINDFIQLFVYASLYYKMTNKYINKLTIYNPLYMIEYNVEINNDTITNILNIITNYDIGGNFNTSEWNKNKKLAWEEFKKKDRLLDDINNLIQEIELSIKTTKEQYNEFNKKMNDYDIKINNLLNKLKP